MLGDLLGGAIKIVGDLTGNNYAAEIATPLILIGAAAIVGGTVLATCCCLSGDVHHHEE